MKIEKLLGFGVVGLLLYKALQYSQVSDRAKVVKVDILSIGLTWIKLNIRVANYATVPVPFTGFNGMVLLKGVDVSDVNLLPGAKTEIAPSSFVDYPVTCNLNLTAFAGLGIDIYNVINAGGLKTLLTQLQPVLKGTIYSNTLSADVNIPLI